jgi:hypothetical protein
LTGLYTVHIGLLQSYYTTPQCTEGIRDARLRNREFRYLSNTYNAHNINNKTQSHPEN